MSCPECLLAPWVCSLPLNGPGHLCLVVPIPSPNTGSQMSDLNTASMAELVISTFDENFPTHDPSLVNWAKKRSEACVEPLTLVLTVGCTFI